MFRKVSLSLVGVIAVMAFASAAMATTIQTTCASTTPIIKIPAGQTFSLTDVTIANGDAVPASVAITDSFTNDVKYIVPALSTQTQDFETPIKFVVGPVNVLLFCTPADAAIVVTVQGRFSSQDSQD